VGGVAKIGLTGGIGSGKSTVAAMFAAMGVPVLDLDRVGRRVAERAEVKAALVSAFGKAVLAADGRLDRRRLASLCFASEEKTALLNSIMHPPIWRQAEAWIAEQHAPYVLIEASVLIESGAASRMDAVIVVLAAEDVRLQRVLARGDLDRTRFRAILARQCSDAERRQVADYVIENNGSLEQLRVRVKRLHRLLMERYADHT